MPIPLQVDFDAAQLRAVARRTKDGPQTRRLLALAAIYDEAASGGSRDPANAMEWYQALARNRLKSAMLPAAEITAIHADV